MEGRKYFFRQVIFYTERLLNNRQIHKADHVLANVGFSSKNVFFEISKESTEENLREYLIEYFKQTFEDFGSTLMSLEEEWFIFNNLKPHMETLIKKFNGNLTEFSFTFFDQFCKIEKDMRAKIITYTFFATKGKFFYVRKRDMIWVYGFF